MTWANASVDVMRCHHAENLPCEEAIPEHLLYPSLELASEWARMQLPERLDRVVNNPDIAIKPADKGANG